MLSHVKFVDLPVHDQDRAIAFYTGNLGMVVAEDSPYQEDWRWVQLAIPGAATQILLVRRGTGASGASPALLLIPNDLDGACAQLRERGVALTQEPTEAPWNPGERYALFKDSEENTILLGSS